MGQQRKRLPIYKDADHLVFGDHSSARPKRPRYSPEVERDSKIPIEPADPALYGRYVKERAARALQGTFEPSSHVPRKRSECPQERPCPAVKCRMHLYVHEPPGRPGLENVPRDRNGRPLVTHGDMSHGQGARLRLEPLWLESPLRASCALDVAEEGLHDNQSLGGYLQKHRTWVARLVKRALQAASRRGLTSEDLIRLIDPRG